MPNHPSIPIFVPVTCKSQCTGMGRRYLAGTAGEELHCWLVAGTALSYGPSGLLPYLSLRAKTLLCISLVFSGLGILPMLPNPLENILQSLGLFLGARISFLACLHSKQPLLLSFFSPKECINFLNISLCLKLDWHFPYLWPAQWCYTFPFLAFFFLFFFSLWFISGKRGLQWLLANAGKEDKAKYKLDSGLLSFQGWSFICPSAKLVNLFQGLTFISYPWIKIGIFDVGRWKQHNVVFWGGHISLGSTLGALPCMLVAWGCSVSFLASKG